MVKLSLKQIVKRTVLSLLYWTRAFDGIRNISERRENKAVILCYHRVINGKIDYYSNEGSQIDIDNFKSHLNALKKKYKIVSLSELVQMLKSGYMEDNCLALTFDDGFIDNFTNAVPILTQLNIPATFFISGGAIDRRALFWQNELWYYLHSSGCPGSVKWKEKILPLSTESEKVRVKEIIDHDLYAAKKEVREIYLRELRKIFKVVATENLQDKIMIGPNELNRMRGNPLFEFGAHSMTHQIMPSLTLDQIQEDVRSEKQLWEKFIDKPLRYFAYPFGRYSENVIKVLNENGYEAAFVTDSGFVKPYDNLHILKRICVRRDDSLESLIVRRLLPQYFKHLLNFIFK